MDPKYLPGTILISNNFIPFDVATNKILFNEKKIVKNSLVDDIKLLIKKEYNHLVCNYVNHYYDSANKIKNDKSNDIELNDFQMTTILQVDDLWNPRNFNEKVKIIL